MTIHEFQVPAWKKSQSRRMIMTEKFYFFDVGVANYLARRRPLLGSCEFGESFEHYILMERRAYQAYKNPDLPLAYWRTSTGLEVDFILGDKQVALEIKSSRNIHQRDLKGLNAIRQDGPVGHCLLVCMEKEPRTLPDDIKIVPWKIFLEQLWAGDYL